MKSIITLILFTLIFSSQSLFGQKPYIEFRNGKVFVDGKAYLKYENSFSNCLFYDLAGNQVIYSQSYGPTEVHKSYWKVVFLKEKITVTNQSLSYSKRKLVKMLLKDKILHNATFVPENIELFALKYHEKIDKITPVKVNVKNELVKSD